MARAAVRVNKYLITGVVLCIFQYLIYIGGYDYLLTFDPFVTHHFVELPASFILGVGLSKYLEDSGFSFTKSWIVNASMVASVIVFNFFSNGVGGLIASLIVLGPELIGFILHRVAKVRQ